LQSTVKPGGTMLSHNMINLLPWNKYYLCFGEFCQTHGHCLWYHAAGRHNHFKVIFLSVIDHCLCKVA